MLLACGTKAGCGERSGRGLERRVVGDIEAPVPRKPSHFGIGKITLDDCEQPRDLFRAALVLDEPAIS